jgi:hypothetical protein
MFTSYQCLDPSVAVLTMSWDISTSPSRMAPSPETYKNRHADHQKGSLDLSKLL